jgi:hypothetical protein
MLRVVWVLLKYLFYLAIIIGFVAFVPVLVNFIIRNF